MAPQRFNFFIFLFFFYCYRAHRDLHSFPTRRSSDLLLRPKAPITGEAFAALLKRLRDDGEMLKIFEPYRIDVTAVP